MTGKKKIGIVGGMGPMATVYLFQKIVENTESPDDQGHIRIFMTIVPDSRQDQGIIGETTLRQMILPVPSAGDMILMPCTLHYYLRKSRILLLNHQYDRGRLVFGRSAYGRPSRQPEP